MTSFVRGIALLGFDEFATGQGLDPRRLLEDVGLPADVVDGLIPGARFLALLELSAQRSTNPLFGLEFGLQQGSQALGDLFYVLRGAGTVGEALDALTRCFHVHSSGAQLRLERQGAGARLLYDVTEGDAASVRQTVELAMGLGAHLMQSLLGYTWKPKGLLLRHPAGTGPDAYRRLLGVTPRFDSPVNAWVFEEAWLATPLVATDERFRQWARRHLDELAQLSLQGLPSYVQKLLRDWLPHGQVTVEQVADHLQLSPRSLQRYFLAQGTSFQALLDSTRQSMASRYLCDTAISLTQLAGLLGYADLSAFSRAFTRWNGVSPQQWKRQQRQAQAAPRGGDDQHRPDTLPQPAGTWACP